MLELGIGSYAVRMILWLYLLIFACCILVAIRWETTVRRRAIGVVIVLMIFVCPALPGLYKEAKFRHAQKKGAALFEERCKSAVLEVRRKVDGVSGLLLLDVRSTDLAANRAKKYWIDAGLPHEGTKEEFIRNFLYWEHRHENQLRGYLTPSPNAAVGEEVSRGYDFVEVREPSGGFVRVRLGATERADLVREAVDKPTARYAFSLKEIDDPEGREYWVAGLRGTLIDTSDNSVVATQTWFAFERGQGRVDGGRQPWGFAQQCPVWKSTLSGQTRMFADQILVPKRGANNAQ